MTSNSDLRQFACEMALAAGKLIGDMAQKPLEVTTKGFRDTVTAADYAAQKLIVDLVRARYPEHGFIGEEEDDSLSDDAEVLWIIDPIDGTSNYARNVPLSTVSIAAAVNGVVVAGAIYDPSRGELFSAELNKGAWLNNTPIQVSPIDDIGNAIVSFDWSRSQANRERMLATLNNLAYEAKTLRSIGSAAIVMGWVAAGRIDVYFNFQLGAWDIAAGALIIAEAGGKVSGLDNSPFDVQDSNTWTAISNGKLHPVFLDLLNR
ncbi:MAG: inositol monophosphatase family protein [Candidatus Promineifilaceae bacterium]